MGAAVPSIGAPMYLLTVTHIEPNPDYRPGYMYGSNPATIERVVLTMHVTPEQFDAIRNAAIEVAK